MKKQHIARNGDENGTKREIGGGHPPDPRSTFSPIAISGHPRKVSKFENVRININEHAKKAQKP
jgi:hypothetical protein